MTGPDLGPYVSRTRRLLETAPPTTACETRAHFVDPFLDALGWNVYTNACRTNVAVDDTHLEYVLSIDSVPALFVAVEPLEDSLAESRAAALLEAMAWTGVDRAIYTNGRHFLFLAGTMDIDRLGCHHTTLTDHERSIDHFTRRSLDSHLEYHDRAFVARQLATERNSLVESIRSTLQDHADESEPYDSEFESATERFLDKLIVSFVRGEGDHPEPADVALEFTDGTTDEYTTAIEPADSSPAGSSYRSNGAPDDSADDEGSPSAESTASSGSDANPTTHVPDADATTSSPGADSAAGDDSLADDQVEPSATTATETGNSEYVVRFFNERGSIGAIGHSSSDGALVQTAEYLFERGLSGIRVPWRPEDGDRTILNDEPTRDDGSSMDDPRGLSNGLYLEAGGDLDTHRRRVQALASRAGLRAMLTGDWEDTD
ncbi:hypothetical protein D8Y22_20470 [Salinadaptatus halalkaliphilus]|uniref:Type I restriction enzyme R protein N-terminal domain-containing protein n=1 Tax=Salinadaptatus halalkaliphilus TaxID=2419781 RepID=A0A4S3TJS5_9EURY|nr:hypothetical protein [Salinadaptatus halalkaliphilus]THE62838.1 hypothetical protein D8Y22_20470 [Salinadaptatus halalkaliphilus]